MVNEKNKEIKVIRIRMPYLKEFIKWLHPALWIVLTLVFIFYTLPRLSEIISIFGLDPIKIVSHLTGSLIGIIWLFIIAYSINIKSLRCFLFLSFWLVLALILEIILLVIIF